VGRKKVDTLQMPPLQRPPLHMQQCLTLDLIKKLTLDLIVNLENHLISTSPSPKN
jgi:hypothetical protein